ALPFGRKPHTDCAGSREGIIVVDPMANMVRHGADVAGGGFDTDRGVELEQLKDGPKAVMAHIGNRPATELIPTTEICVCIVRVIRPVQRWTEPECPIKIFRTRRCVRW